MPEIKTPPKRRNLVGSTEYHKTPAHYKANSLDATPSEPFPNAPGLPAPPAGWVPIPGSTTYADGGYARSWVSGCDDADPYTIPHDHLSHQSELDPGGINLAAGYFVNNAARLNGCMRQGLSGPTSLRGRAQPLQTWSIYVKQPASFVSREGPTGLPSAMFNMGPQNRTAQLPWVSQPVHMRARFVFDGGGMPIPDPTTPTDDLDHPDDVWGVEGEHPDAPGWWRVFVTKAFDKDSEQIRGSFRADGFHAPHFLNPFLHPHDVNDGPVADHRYEGLFLWGAQFEHGPLTPYQPRLSDYEWALVGDAPDFTFDILTAGGSARTQSIQAVYADGRLGRAASRDLDPARLKAYVHRVGNAGRAELAWLEEMLDKTATGTIPMLYPATAHGHWQDGDVRVVFLDPGLLRRQVHAGLGSFDIPLLEWIG